MLSVTTSVEPHCCGLYHKAATIIIVTSCPQLNADDEFLFLGERLAVLTQYELPIFSGWL